MLFILAVLSLLLEIYMFLNLISIVIAFTLGILFGYLRFEDNIFKNV